MTFKLLFVIFIVVAVLDYIFLDMKINKIEKERSLDRDKVIGSLMAHNQVLRKLNDGFKDHERRINDIEEHLSLSREPEKKEEDLDEDEDEDVIYYANNVKVDIQSKAPYVVYKTDGLLPEEYASLVSKLYYSD